MRKSIKSNEWLYGDGVDVPEIPNYVKMRRVELLNEHLEELLDVEFKERNACRISAVIRAIHFWEGLDKEEDIKLDE